MKRWNLNNTILIGAWAMLAMTQAYAGIPLWTYSAPSPATTTVSAGGLATIQYTVTNQSTKTKDLILQATPGLSASSCHLASKGSTCALTLTVDGSAVPEEGIHTGPVLCEQGNPLQCHQPSQVNRLNITQSNTSNHTVGGTITGLTDTVTLLNNGTNSTTISTDGNFTFSTAIAEGSPYAVTIQTQPANQTCTVANGTGTVGGANVTNVIVTCSTNTFTIGGGVSGLTGTVTLLNNNTNPTPISVDGPFTFSTPIAEGSTYAVTIQSQPVNQTCTVANGTGTVGGANVTNVILTCSTNTFTVGGSVSGLTGTVTLLNNGTNPTSISADGPFTFSTPIADGSPYAVTIQTQPAAQTCNVSNASGTISGNDVTNVDVTCVAQNTTISVPATGTIPVNNGTNTFTVTNTGAFAALNVRAILPGAWTVANAVTQDATDCTSIPPISSAPNNTCTLTFSSNLPFVAQGAIVITGDNISLPPTTALAFTATANNYLIWAVSGSTVQVIDTANLPSSAQQWGGYGTTIGVGAQSFTDGPSNTSAIVSNLGSGSSYAARGCNQSTNGGASIGTWYLPAICQMGGAGQGAECSFGLANIDTNLVRLGFGGLAGGYWGSTENSFSPQFYAWYEYFASGGGSNQYVNVKDDEFGVRCSRALTL